MERTGFANGLDVFSDSFHVKHMNRLGKTIERDGICLHCGNRQKATETGGFGIIEVLNTGRNSHVGNRSKQTVENRSCHDR